MRVRFVAYGRRYLPFSDCRREKRRVGAPLECGPEVLVETDPVHLARCHHGGHYLVVVGSLFRLAAVGDLADDRAGPYRLLGRVVVISGAEGYEGEQVVKLPPQPLDESFAVLLRVLPVDQLRTRAFILLTLNFLVFALSPSFCPFSGLAASCRILLSVLANGMNSGPGFL